MDPYLSVVVCTYIRTHRLIECLKTLEEQTLDRSCFEVVIVTRGLSDEYEKQLSDFVNSTNLSTNRVRMPEDLAGVSAARNAGLKSAKGEIIHFLDDDTLASPECLQSYVDVFKSTDALCVGGKILPKFVTPPPSWLRRSHWPFLGTLDLGDDICSFSYPSNFPVGANVAFRREVFERFGPFDEDLGVLGRRRADGDETDICFRIQFAGGKLLYDPKALIYHCIEGDKLNKRWILRRALRLGKGSAILQLKHSPPITVIGSNLKSFFKKPDRLVTGAGKSQDGPLHTRVFYFETKIALVLGYLLEMTKILFR